MHVQSSHSNATFDLTYHATAKLLINGSASVVMLGASESKQWSLPACRTDGFLIWGTGGFTNWAWFGLRIPQTGYVLIIWTGDMDTDGTAPVAPG
ncbi:hypothetical protein BDW71DRAFT_209981 [Aspergillus fruticulosus]